MAFVIDCECGVQLRGQAVPLLLESADAHITDAHPELGRVPHDQLMHLVREL